MANFALLSAIKELALPEHIVRSVLADYMDFLKDRQIKAYESLNQRLQNDPKLFDSMYFEVQGSILASTLMLTLEADVDTDEIFEEVYGKQNDTDLLAMRRELVSRALAQSKDAAPLAGISNTLVKSRKANFCGD
jgi:hypothetical protein